MGGPIFMAVRQLKKQALSTIITSLSIAMACGLMMAVYAVKDQARDAFIMKNCGFDGVLGPKGSSLQLVLNAVFHMESSEGNISWKM